MNSSATKHKAWKFEQRYKSIHESSGYTLCLFRHLARFIRNIESTAKKMAGTSTVHEEKAELGAVEETWICGHA
jgi:hypothetical protein